MVRRFVLPIGRVVLMLSTICVCQPLYAQTAIFAQTPPADRDASDPVAALESLPAQISRLPDVQAQMKVIHRRSQLVVARSNVVRTAIADSNVVDVVQYSPNELSIIGLQLGSTTVTLWFEGENGQNSEPLIYLVEVIRDPSVEDRQRHDYGKLEKKLAIFFPNSKVYLIPMSGKIIVKGQARDGQEANNILSLIRGEVINQNGSLPGPQPAALPGVDPSATVNPQDMAAGFIVNMLEIPGEFQINLRVRIAELNRSMLRRWGVNFSALINGGQTFFSSLMSGTFANSNVGQGGAAGGAGQNTTGTLQGIFSSGDINVLINALAANGTTKILAEPNITVISGHPASFLSGGEFAVPTIVGVQGVGAQQTSFRGFGVSLIVTPMLLDKDIIRMQILPEFSQISIQNRVNGIPGTSVRRVQTTVELREGQTIALAGLLSHQTDVENDRMPYLGEIPFFGSFFFNAKRANQDEKELLILVTPEIVRPLEPDEVPPVPGYEVTHPDDTQLYWYNRTEGAPDQQVYQLAPYGNGSGQGISIGYSQFNPAPAAPGYGPAPTMPFGGGQANPLGNNAPPPGGGPGGRYQMTPARRENAGTRTPVPLRSAGGYPTPVSSTGGRYGTSPAGPVVNGGYSAPPDAGGVTPAGYTVPASTPPAQPKPRRWFER